MCYSLIPRSHSNPEFPCHSHANINFVSVSKLRTKEGMQHYAAVESKLCCLYKGHYLQEFIVSRGNFFSF